MAWGLLATVVAQSVTDVTWIERGGIIAVLVVVLYLFQTGRILPSNTVRREDYDKAMEINASYAEALPLLTKAVNDAITLARQ